MANIEELVLTLEQMNHLKKLGLKVKDTVMSWVQYPAYKSDGKIAMIRRVVITKDESLFMDDLYPTLTLQEIIEMLPFGMTRYKDDETLILFDKNGKEISITVQKDKFDNNVNVLEGAYKMLCWLTKEGYLKKRRNETTNIK